MNTIIRFQMYTYDLNFVLQFLGVPQGDDILIMFPDIIGGKKINYTEGDLLYSDKLLRIIVNFAKEG